MIRRWLRGRRDRRARVRALEQRIDELAAETATIEAERDEASRERDRLRAAEAVAAEAFAILDAAACRQFEADHAELIAIYQGDR